MDTKELDGEINARLNDILPGQSGREMLHAAKESQHKVNALRCSLNGQDDIDIVWPGWWNNESIAWRMRHLATWVRLMALEMSLCLNAEYHHKMQAIQDEQKSNRIAGGE